MSFVPEKFSGTKVPEILISEGDCCVLCVAQLKRNWDWIPENGLELVSLCEVRAFLLKRYLQNNFVKNKFCK